MRHPIWRYDHVTCSLANGSYWVESEWKAGPLAVPFALDDQCSPMMPPPAASEESALALRV